MIENCRERNFISRILAADICLLKMVAEFLSRPKRQFHPPENNRHSFFLYYENSRGQFTIENASRITLHRTDIYLNQPFGAPDMLSKSFTPVTLFQPRSRLASNSNVLSNSLNSLASPLSRSGLCLIKRGDHLRGYTVNRDCIT